MMVLKKVLRILMIAALMPGLSACERVLNLELAKPSDLSPQAFDAMPGVELPYEIYAPSSMMGWELKNATKLHFDKVKKIYVLDNIPLDETLVDDRGRRFKICGSAWRHEFGFGGGLTDPESTIGVPGGEIVAKVAQRVGQPVNTDMFIELPAAGKPPRSMRLEFKFVSWKPVPTGYIHITMR